MNRISFLKTLIGAPMIPLGGSGEKKEPLIEGKLEKCVPPWPYRDKLLNFQQEIWEDYNRFEKNLFIMSRGSSKSFLASRIASLKFGPESGAKFKLDRNCNILVRYKESIIDELTIDCFEYLSTVSEWKGWKTTVFSGVLTENKSLLKEIHKDKKWNVKIFNIENIDPIMYDKKLISYFRSELSESAFEREMLCKIS